MPQLTYEVSFYAEGATPGTPPAVTLRLGVESVRVVHSSENLTATCAIDIAREWKLRGKTLASLIRRRMPVRVRLGWNFHFWDEFVGYVARVSPSSPLRIECEDTMFLLKKPAFSHTFANVGIQGVVDWLKANAPTTPGGEPWGGFWWKGKTAIYDNRLGKFRVVNTPASGILRSFADQYGLRSFFRNDFDALGNAEPVLVVGQIYTNPTARYAVHSFQRSILPGHSLQFTQAEDVKLKIKAINHLPNGQHETFEVGDEGGDSRTLPFFNTPDYKKIAAEKAKRLRFDGYAGSFSVFGADHTGRTRGYLQQADRVTLLDDLFPDRMGQYYIAGTETEMSVSGGYTRNITLGERA